MVLGRWTCGAVVVCRDRPGSTRQEANCPATSPAVGHDERRPTAAASPRPWSLAAASSRLTVLPAALFRSSAGHMLKAMMGQRSVRSARSANWSSVRGGPQAASPARNWLGAVSEPHGIVAARRSTNRWVYRALTLKRASTAELRLTAHNIPPSPAEFHAHVATSRLFQA